MPRTILVVDDDLHIRQLLVFALAKAGLDTVEAEDGEAALAAAEKQAPDLVVLDINMPRMDGIEVCRRLRAAGDLPILFLSSRDDEIDRVLGIELGADDYVTKPFSPREVVARVMAILRRTAGRPPAIAGAAAPLKHGRLILDPDGWQASWEGVPVALTVTEFGILRTPATMPSKVFSRDALIDRLHGPGFAIAHQTIDLIELTVRDNGPGIPVGDRERIFEPFFTSRRVSGGTGLGLPLGRCCALTGARSSSITAARLAPHF